MTARSLQFHAEKDIREVEKEIFALLGHVAAPTEALKDN